MISAYAYAHACNNYSDPLSDEAAGILAKYRTSDAVAKLADAVSTSTLEPAAKVHQPAVVVYEASVAADLADLEGISRNVAREVSRPVTIALVDWMRRNTQFRSIAYTGNDADFIVEG